MSKNKNSRTEEPLHARSYLWKTNRGYLVLDGKRDRAQAVHMYQYESLVGNITAQTAIRKQARLSMEKELAK